MSSIANPLFETPGAVTGTALSWTFADNRNVITSPPDFRLNAGYPNLDASDTGHTGSQMQLGFEGGATDITYVTGDEYTRSVSQLTATVPQFATSFDVRYHKKLDAGGDAGVWKMQLWVNGVMEYEDPIEPGDDVTGSYSHDVTGLVGTEVLVEVRLVQQAQALLGGLLHGHLLESSTVYVAGLSDRNESVGFTPPFTITGMPTDEWALIVKHDPDGEPSWVRTIEDATGRLILQGGARQPNGDDVIIVGMSNGTSVEVRDDTGALLDSIAAPAGTHTWWGFMCNVSLETGAVAWLVKSDWASDPNSTVAGFQFSHVWWGGADLDRLYAIGRWLNSNVSGFNTVLPTWNGVSPPAITPPTATTAQRSGWVMEVNPTNGNGLTMYANDNDSYTSGAVYYRNQDNICPPRGMWDPVNERNVISGGYTGDKSFNGGFMTVGRGSSGAFNTRAFAAWGSGEETKPVLMSFDADLEPVAASTVQINGNPNNNQVSTSGRPFVLADGSIIWTVQQVVTPATLSNIDRSGGAGSYGGTNLTSSFSGAVHIMRIPADHATPTWIQELVLPVSSQEESWDFSYQLSPDANTLWVHCRKWWSNAHNVSFLGEPNVFFDWYETMLVGIDVATGAHTVDAQYTSRTNSLSSAREFALFDSGPAEGKMLCPVAETQGNSVVDGGAGVNNTAASRVYTFHDKWSATKGGPASYAVHLISRDSAGDPIDVESYPAICGTNTAGTGIRNVFATPF